MRGKPLLVAAATFLIVLIGGAAFAGVGMFDAPGSDVEATELGDDPVLDLPDFDTTTTAENVGSSTTTTESPKAAVESESVTDSEKDEGEAGEEEKGEDDEAAQEPDHDRDEAHLVLFTIDRPAMESHVDDEVVTFGGTVADGVTITRGKYTADQSDGTWSMKLVLSPGKNRVGFRAENADGLVQELSVTVFFDAPEEKTPDEEKKDDGEKNQSEYEFWAKQKYGSCGESTPYDVFYGKAIPGTTIEVTSPYGSGSTTAGREGHWEIKVTFPDAPVGEPFTVTVHAGTGEAKTFTFVRSAGDHDGEKDF